MKKIIAPIAALMIGVLLVVGIAGYAASVTYSGITLSTDKDRYLPGETVTITISFEKPFTGSVYLYIYKPGGVLDFFKTLSLNNQQSYSLQYKPTDLGIYTVKANVQGNFAGENRTIVAPASALTVSFTVATQYAVKGQVVDENGNPVAEATVSAAGVKTTTDDMGYFVLSLAKPGNYTIHVKKEGYLPASVNVSVTKMGITELEKPIVIESFTHAILRLQQSIEQLNSRLTELNTTLSNAIATEVNNLRTELTNSINQLSNSVNQKIGSLEQKVNGLETTVSGINDAVKQLSDNVKNLQQSIASLQQSIQSLQQQLQGKADKAELQQLSTALNNLNNKISGMDKTLSSLKTTVNQLQGVVNDLKATVEGLKTTVSGLQTSVSDLKSAMNNVQGQLNTVAQKADAAAKQASTATNKASDAASKAMLGIVIGVIGLIIAIIAVILVYRKIAV